MEIRSAQSRDAASLAALSIEVWIGTYLKQGVATQFADFVLDEFTPVKMSAHLADPAQTILLAQAQDGPVGYIRIHSQSAQPVGGTGQVEIANFYVQPAHQGKGIGKALLGEAARAARKGGATALWLTTNAQNDPAIAFYGAQGFEQVGMVDFVIDKARYPNRVFMLAL